MSTYRARWSDEYKHRPYRAWWNRVPERQKAIIIGVLMLGGFIVASWGDGPYEQPRPVVPGCETDRVWPC